MNRDNVVLTVLTLIVAWFLVAEIVFAFRHPWATDTQRLVHTPDALLFRKIPRE